LLFLVTTAEANPTPEYVKLLLNHIHSISGLEVPEYDNPLFPKIILTDKQTVSTVVCGTAKSCLAVAATKGTTIYISTKDINLNTPEGDTVLYHELVHVAQFTSRGVAKNCIEWRDREIQAYLLQKHYGITKHSIDLDWIDHWINYIGERCNYSK